MKNSAREVFYLIIPYGTQIVMINETKVLNENVFHAKGTVGKIVGLPADAFHAYRIEFSDGSCGMANRKDFMIRKEFQTEQSGLISPLVVQTSKEHEELKEIGKKRVTRNHAHHYFGFARAEWKLFERNRAARETATLYFSRSSDRDKFDADGRNRSEFIKVK